MIARLKRAQAWARVVYAKRFLPHRYDYRAEWLRFTDTLGRPGEDALALGIRIVKAVGDIVAAPGGILLVPQDGGGLIAQSEWNSAQPLPPGLALSAQAAAWFASTGRIVQLDALRGDTASDEEARHIPQWMVTESRAWILVPLVHFERLAGFVLLEKPAFARALDWEDFDLLRVVARQAASYLAEASGQEALSDAQRFDEFNRRFAFIMHDIKNLVSQLSLVTRNAERHADNPAFRADMIATLKSSTGRMNDLLARLSQHNKGRADDPRPVELGLLCEGLAATRRGQHPIVVSGETGLFAIADAARLEQALSHLLHNAIDASPQHEPVSLIVTRAGEEVSVAVRDLGAGMTPAFVRDRLFKPFASTKQNGFGVGAYEARALVAAMGGRIVVNSRVGEATTIAILLPLAREAHGFAPQALAA